MDEGGLVISHRTQSGLEGLYENVLGTRTSLYVIPSAFNEQMRTPSGFSNATALASDADDLYAPFARAGRIRSVHLEWPDDGVDLVAATGALWAATAISGHRIHDHYYAKKAAPSEGSVGGIAGAVWNSPELRAWLSAGPDNPARVVRSVFEGAVNGGAVPAERVAAFLVCMGYDPGSLDYIPDQSMTLPLRVWAGRASPETLGSGGGSSRRVGSSRDSGEVYVLAQALKNPKTKERLSRSLINNPLSLFYALGGPAEPDWGSPWAHHPDVIRPLHLADAEWWLIPHDGGTLSPDGEKKASGNLSRLDAWLLNTISKIPSMATFGAELSVVARQCGALEAAAMRADSGDPLALRIIGSVSDLQANAAHIGSPESAVGEIASDLRALVGPDGAPLAKEAIGALPCALSSAVLDILHSPGDDVPPLLASAFASAVSPVVHGGEPPPFAKKTHSFMNDLLVHKPSWSAVSRFLGWVRDGAQGASPEDTVALLNLLAATQSAALWNDPKGHLTVSPEEAWSGAMRAFPSALSESLYNALSDAGHPITPAIRSALQESMLDRMEVQPPDLSRRRFSATRGG